MLGGAEFGVQVANTTFALSAQADYEAALLGLAMQGIGVIVGTNGGIGPTRKTTSVNAERSGCGGYCSDPEAMMESLYERMVYAARSKPGKEGVGQAGIEAWNNFLEGQAQGFEFWGKGAVVVGTLVVAAEAWIARLAIASLISAVPTAAPVAANGRMCFIEGTRVLMADGSTRAIEAIIVGDLVMTGPSGNVDDRGVEARAVTEIHRTSTYRLFHIHLGGDAGGTVSATGRHPFWTQRGWIPAEALTTVDVLQSENGEAVLIDSIAIESVDAPTYNLSIEGTHTYFVVAGGVSVLVHNVDPWDILFTQKSFGATFADGVWAGRTVQAAAELARTLGRLPDGLTLNAVRMGDGTWAALNNRTLAVARLANLPNVNPIDAGASGLNKLRQLLRNSDLVGPIKDAVMRCR